MPVAAKKYDPEFEVHPVTTARPHAKRGKAARAAAPAQWNQFESLVNHFGATAAEPALPLSQPQRTPKVRNPKRKQRTTEDLQISPRQRQQHRPFRLAPAAVLMCSTIGILLIALLTIHGFTLGLARQEVRVAKETKIAREAIDNANKSIAAIQISPEMAQWAVANGWHVAEQADFDEVPMQMEAGGQQ